MVKIKCCECGEIFPKLDGEVQVCPHCKAKMKISISGSVPKENEAPQDIRNEKAPEVIEDSYSQIRRDYAELMKRQVQNGDDPEEEMVVIPKRIYDALVSGKIFKKTESGDSEAAPVENKPVAAESKKTERQVKAAKKEKPVCVKSGKKPAVCSLIMMLLVFAGAVAAYFIDLIESKQDKTLFSIIKNSIESESYIKAAALCGVLLIALICTIIFIVNRRKKGMKIFCGFAYIIAGVAIAASYFLYEGLLTKTFTVDYLYFYNYYTIPFTVITGAVTLIGLIFLICGIFQKSDRKK